MLFPILSAATLHYYVFMVSKSKINLFSQAFVYHFKHIGDIHDSVCFLALDANFTWVYLIVMFDGFGYVIDVSKFFGLDLFYVINLNLET